MVEAGAGRSLTGVGTGFFTEFLKVGANATAAKMLPGIAVIFDTNQYSVKQSNDGTNVIGTLGYENTQVPWKPTNYTTAYAVGDTVAIEMGVSRRKMLLIANQAIVKGNPLKVTTDGYVTVGVPGTDDIYADADESLGSVAAVQYLWVVTRR